MILAPLLESKLTFYNCPIELSNSNILFKGNQNFNLFDSNLDIQGLEILSPSDSYTFSLNFFNLV
jgi:hypothetical protein